MSTANHLIHSPRVLFFGTPEIAVPILASLFQKQYICGVVTNPDAVQGRKQISTPSPVAVFAQNNNLPLFKPNAPATDVAFQDALRKLKPDLACIVAYGHILPTRIINLPKFGSYNIHFSLLPAYRGASPLQAAIRNGDTQSGVTFFKLDTKMDHGPIVWQKTVSIHSTETAYTYGSRLSSITAQMLPEIIKQLYRNEIIPVEQDHTQATYCKKITKVEGLINWNQSATEIFNQYRAFTPWPGIFTKAQDIQTYKITSCEPSIHSHAAPVGTILDTGEVACAKGTILKIREIQPAGKNKMSFPDFLRGKLHVKNTKFFL